MTEMYPGTLNKKQKKDEGYCSLFFLKYVLFVFNAIFWLTGIGFLAVGIWAFINRHGYISLLGNSILPTTTYMFIGVGVFILIVGALGCVGIFKESRACLVAYAFCLLVIFLVEAIAGVLAYMYEGAIREELKRHLNETMIENYRYDLEISNAIDDMQRTFLCCGAGSYIDWQYSKWLKNDKSTQDKTPDSCCKTESIGCARSDHPSNINDKGCARRLEGNIKQHLILIGGIGLGFCCLQVFGIIFACCLARKIKEHSYSY